jgi:protein-disulfide isomerase
MKSEWISNLLTGVLVVCALIVTALVARRELMPTARQHAPEPEFVSQWQRFAAAGQRMGPATAPVTVVEFSDFQCPACRALASSIEEIRRREPSRVAVVYRHFPLSGHPHARAAAHASECAASQSAFGAFHNLLFAEQASIGQTGWADFARRAGVRDLGAFETCLGDSSRAQSVLQRDSLAGAELHVAPTPTFMINGWKIVGVPPLDTIRAYIDRYDTQRQQAR